MSHYTAGVSIVICTFNGKSKLGPTLAHLAAQQGIDNIPVELLVIDNASTDGTAQFVSEQWQQLHSPFPLTLLSEPRPGKGLASLTGFTASRFSYILVCDDDNWLAPDYVKKAFSIMEASPATGVLGGSSEAVFEGTAPPWFKHYEGLFAVGSQCARNGDVTGYCDFLWGAGMVFKRECWEKLQQINYVFFLNETRGGKSNWGGDDVELFEMILMMGYGVWYDNTLWFKHYMPAGRVTYNYLKTRYYGLGRSRVYLRVYDYCRKHDVIPGGHLKYPLWLDKLQYILRQYIKQWPAHIFEDTSKVSEDYLKFIALKGEIHEFWQLKSLYNNIYTKIFAYKNALRNIV